MPVLFYASLSFSKSTILAIFDSMWSDELLTDTYDTADLEQCAAHFLHVDVLTIVSPGIYRQKPTFAFGTNDSFPWYTNKSSTSYLVQHKLPIPRNLYSTPTA